MRGDESEINRSRCFGSGCRTEKTTDTWGQLDILLGDTKAKLARQQEVSLSGGHLNLHCNVLIVGFLCNSHHLVTRLVVSELIAEGQIDAVWKKFENFLKGTRKRKTIPVRLNRASPTIKCHNWRVSSLFCICRVVTIGFPCSHTWQR